MSYDHDHAAQYVRAGRCVHCGHKKVTWSPERIIVAAQAWLMDHGQAPRARDWKYASVDHPAHQTVTHVFGTWNRMILASRTDARCREFGSGPVWTKEQIAEAMLDWLGRTGSWPKSRDWTYANGDEASRPSYLTVVSIFGSWNEGKRYAGWDGSDGRRRMVAERFRCSGCGGDEYSETIGCDTCWDRLRKRASRRAAANLGTGLRALEPLAGGSGAGADGESHPARPKHLSTETAAQAA